MEVKCNIDKTHAIIKDLELQAERYNEIVKNFYDIVSSFKAYGWVGNASSNYAKYLVDKKGDFDAIYSTLVTFNRALNKGVNELEEAVKISKVNGND